MDVSSPSETGVSVTRRSSGELGLKSREACRDEFGRVLPGAWPAEEPVLAVGEDAHADAAVFLGLGEVVV